jgi:hypothetical protein
VLHWVCLTPATPHIIKRYKGLAYQGATPSIRESFKKYVHVPGERGRKKITEIVHTRLDIKEKQFFVKKILFQNTVKKQST